LQRRVLSQSTLTRENQGTQRCMTTDTLRLAVVLMSLRARVHCPFSSFPTSVPAMPSLRRHDERKPPEFVTLYFGHPLHHPDCARHSESGSDISARKARPSKYS